MQRGTFKNTIHTSKWNYKKCSSDIDQKKAGRRKRELKSATKENKQKIKNKTRDLNPKILIITLNGRL